jgi:hypothetical protein
MMMMMMMRPSSCWSFLQAACTWTAAEVGNSSHQLKSTTCCSLKLTVMHHYMFICA